MNRPKTRKGIVHLALSASVALCASTLSLRAAEVARFVEYIQTDGLGSTVGEYVLLDYKPTALSIVEMDIELLDTSNTQTMFCSRGSKANSNTFTLFWVGNEGFRWDYNRTTAQYATGVGAGERHVIRCGPNGFWIDGVSNTVIKVSPVSYTPANKMTLFASYTANTTATPAPSANWAKMRLYSFKAWDNNGATLKVHLRPCLDTAGVAGLYDAVSGKIYYNKRSGKTFSVSESNAPDTLSITCDSVSFVSPSPDYGMIFDLKSDDSLAVSCPAAWTNADETIAAVCTGWKLYDAAGTVVSNGVGTAFTYVHPGVPRRLEWQLDVRYKVRAEADVGGAAEPAEQWVRHGTEVVFTAVPDSESTFLNWTEAGSGAVYESNPLALAVATNFSLTAHFAFNYYVDEEGSDEADGRSPETAFATLTNALAHALQMYGNRVILLPGSHAIPGDAYVWVSNGVSVVSSTGDPQDATISSVNGYGLRLSDAKSSVRGVTLESGTMPSSARTLLIYPGIVSNCVVRGGSGAGAVVDIRAGGVVDGCVVDGVRATSAAVVQSGGSLLRTIVRNCSGYTSGAVNVPNSATETCAIADCVISNNVGSEIGGLRLAAPKSTVRGCLIYGNRESNNDSNSHRSAGILFREGTHFVSETRVVGNVSAGSVGGVSVDDGYVYMTNCLIAGNSAVRKAGGFYDLKHTRLHVVNCTIADNSLSTTSAEEAGGYFKYHTASTANTRFFNCVFDGNTLRGGAVSDVAVYESVATPGLTHSRFAEADETDGNGNISAPARLRGDYHLRQGSPCVDSGLTLGWTREDSDLDGNCRFRGAGVDMGCFEVSIAPTFIMAQ